MRICQLFIYPIKSLRGISLDSSELCAHGLVYDRKFMLLRVLEDGNFKNMQVSKVPEMCLFHPTIKDYMIHVSYRKPAVPVAPETEAQDTVLQIPLEPEYRDREQLPVNMYGSCTSGYLMDEKYNRWFSDCFGYRVVLVYLGDGRRPVLGTLSPNAQTLQQPRGWLSRFGGCARPIKKDTISFSDVAAFLVVSAASLRDVHTLLSNNEKMDITKFRPNIVIGDDDGDLAPWAEDFWAELKIGDTVIVLTHNCGRCVSVNIDYATGRAGKGETGSILKKLSSKRRVDAGNKWSPVFGRYGFLREDLSDGIISVGDEVKITKRNAERTKWDWPGL